MYLYTRIELYKLTLLVKMQAEVNTAAL